MTNQTMARRKTRMGRPKTVKHGLKLNLYVDREIKRKLFIMAAARRTSISAVIRDMVFDAAAPKPEQKEFNP